MLCHKVGYEGVIIGIVWRWNKSSRRENYKEIKEYYIDFNVDLNKITPKERRHDKNINGWLRWSIK